MQSGRLSAAAFFAAELTRSLQLRIAQRSFRIQYDYCAWLLHRAETMRVS